MEISFINTNFTYPHVYSNSYDSNQLAKKITAIVLALFLSLATLETLILPPLFMLAALMYEPSKASFCIFPTHEYENTPVIVTPPVITTPVITTPVQSRPWFSHIPTIFRRGAATCNSNTGMHAPVGGGHTTPVVITTPPVSSYGSPSRSSSACNSNNGMHAPVGTGQRTPVDYSVKITPVNRRR